MSENFDQNLCKMKVGDVVISKIPLPNVKLRIAKIQDHIFYLIPLPSMLIGRDQDFMKIDDHSAFLKNNNDIINHSDVVSKIEFPEVPENQTSRHWTFHIFDIVQLKDKSIKGIIDIRPSGTLLTVDYATNQTSEEHKENEDSLETQQYILNAGGEGDNE